MSHRYHILVVLMLVLVGTSVVPAQEEPVTVVVAAAAETAAEATAYERIIAESIGVVLVRSGFAIASIGDAATDLRWEYAILSLVPRLHMSISVRDTATGTIVSSVSGRARANVTLFNALDELVSVTVDDALRYLALNREFGDEIRPVPVAGLLPPVAPRGDDEEVVLQPAAPLHGTADRGVLLADGVQVPVQVRRRGHYVTTAPARMDGTLPEPEPYRRTGLQVHTSLGRLVGAGIGARLDLIPDRAGVAGELDVYSSGVTQGAPYRVLHLEGRLLANLRLLRWGPVSLRASTGLGTVVTTFLSGIVAPYTDLYWNVLNLTPTLHTGRQAWFARVGLNYRVASDRGFFPDGLDSGMPQLFVGTFRRF